MKARSRRPGFESLLDTAIPNIFHEQRALESISIRLGEDVAESDHYRALAELDPRPKWEIHGDPLAEMSGHPLYQLE